MLSSSGKNILWKLKFTHIIISPFMVNITICRPRWLSFPPILTTVRMTSTHWPHQHFDLLSCLTYPTAHSLLQQVELSNQNLQARAYWSIGWLPSVLDKFTLGLLSALHLIRTFSVNSFLKEFELRFIYVHVQISLWNVSKRSNLL